MQNPAALLLQSKEEWVFWEILGMGILLGSLASFSIQWLKSRFMPGASVEEAIALSPVEFNAILAALNDVIFIFDRQGRYLKAIPTHSRQLYRPAAEIIGKTVCDLFDPELAQFFLKHIHQSLETQQTVCIEYRLPIEGQWVWFAAKLLPMDLDLAICVAQDITAQKQAASAIGLLNSQLEHRVQERTQSLQAANQELEAFCYSISHDLRSPLRRIGGFSQAILEDCGEQLNRTAQDYLQRVIQSTQRLEQMIDDLLSLSHLNLQELNADWIDLSQIACPITRELHQSAPTRRVEFKIVPQAIAYADSRLLQIVLENLLENAWKYTSKRSLAYIEFGVLPHPLISSAFTCNVPTDPIQGKSGSPRAEFKPYEWIYGAGQEGGSSPNTFTFFVRDNGTGFNMSYANKLFAPFQRLHNADEFEGTGIGLAIVQRAIHRHGGRVWAQATPNQGATFFFSLPFSESEIEPLLSQKSTPINPSSPRV